MHRRRLVWQQGGQPGAAGSLGGLPCIPSSEGVRPVPRTAAGEAEEGRFTGRGMGWFRLRDQPWSNREHVGAPEKSGSTQKRSADPGGT